ncbi:hypothetical protein [Gymnodinialimonas sp. 57CJ19]|uniref:hypothetical protein n=1 Tax=Gymnodinialimonas sp. 57CJ19 TaxID=3138498 RepID=UPI0031342926
MPVTARTPVKHGFAAPYIATTQPHLAEVEFDLETLLNRSTQRHLMIAGAVVVACVSTCILTVELQTFPVLTAVLAACGCNAPGSTQVRKLVGVTLSHPLPYFRINGRLVSAPSGENIHRRDQGSRAVTR